VNNRDNTTSVSRRGFLGAVGLGTLGSLPTGAVGVATLDDKYRTVVDVRDEGADASGSTSVSALLGDLVDDDTLLRFPPGRYYMDAQVRASGITNVGLVGDDATLVPAAYGDFEGPTYRLFRLGTHEDPGRDVRVDGFDVDQRAPDTGIRAFHLSAADGLRLANVDFVGRHDSGTWGPVLVRVTDPGGSGVVEGVRMPDGADWETETPGDLWRGPTGILVNGHRGHLDVRDCVVDNFPDNGLYAQAAGTVSVRGGRFANSGPVNVRIGAREAVVEGATVTVDDQAPNYAAQLPMRFDYADSVEIDGVDVDIPAPGGDAVQVHDGVERTAIRRSDFSIGDGPASGIVARDGSGPISLVDVDIDIESSGNAVRALGAGGSLVVQGGRIGGGASGERLRHAVRCERDGSEFRQLTVDQWGGGRRRGLALLGDDAVVYDCRIRSSDWPVHALGTDLWIEDSYLNSYAATDSIRIAPSADTVRIKNNGLPDGIEDDGGSDVSVSGTTY
jgi:hypothetical protein